MTIVELVDRERSALRRRGLAAGVALVIAATSLLLAAGSLTLGRARWLSLPRAVPFVVWLLVLAADVALFVWTVRRLRHRAARASVAASIERENELRAGAVRGVIEVADVNAFGRLAAARLAASLAPRSGRLAPQARRDARRLLWQGGAVAGLALLTLGWTAPVFDDGLRAIFRPVDAWRGTLLPKLQFVSLPPAVLRGENVRLEIAAPARASIVLSQRTPGEAWRSEAVAVDRKTGIATIEVGPVRGDLSLVATDGRSETDTVLVRATDRPFLGAVSMRAVYPAYLARPAEGLPVGEPARVPQGTSIEVSGRASTALRDVRLMNGNESASLSVKDHAFVGAFSPKVSGRWSWNATGAGGPISDVPLPLELEIVADSAPHVDLVSPAADTLVAGDDRVAMHVTASDDHGLARVDMVMWQQGPRGQETNQTVDRLIENGTTVWNGSPVVDLAAHHLQAGEALHVKFVATDNSPWAQKGESREVMLRIPTMEERRAIARALGDSTVSQVQAAAKSQKALEQRTSDAMRDRGQRNAQQDAQSNASGKDAMSYDAAEKAKQMAQDQKALGDQIKQLQDRAAQLQEQLKQAGALDSALARQLQEAQALLRDALTPEMLAQMQKLQEAGQQLSREQSQQTLRDLQAQQQRLREQLEKSAEMLKRAALEGAMQTLKDEAKDIANRDRQLADSAAAEAKRDQKPSNTDSAEAKNLADRSQRFEDEIKRLQDKLQQANADASKQPAEQAKEHAKASEDALRQAANQQQAAGQQKSGQQQGGQPQNGQQQNGQPQSGQQQNGMQQAARDAASEMQKAEQSMQDARSSQVTQWKQELTGALDQSIQEMLQMARQESAMEQKARSGQSSQQDLRGEQSAIKQGVDNAAQRLEKESQKSSLLSGRSQRAVSEAQQKVAQATQSAADPRNGQQTASTMGEAADALNRAAASLARDRERANTVGSATGFAEMLQQMQEMAKKQGSINAQAEGLIPGMSQSMTSQGQATARALAREQRQVAQQLEELGDAAGGDRAAQLAKEARQVADALDGGRIDGTTVARQQQLFRRLLDAGRTLEKDEREDTNKREAQSYTGDNAFKPDNSNASGKAAEKFREPTWDELRGLSADERRAILDYFKRINGKP